MIRKDLKVLSQLKYRKPDVSLRSGSKTRGRQAVVLHLMSLGLTFAPEKANNQMMLATTSCVCYCWCGGCIAVSCVLDLVPPWVTKT